MAPTRRQFLGAATASAVAGLSGCAGDGDDSTPTDTATATPAATTTESGDSSTDTDETTQTEEAMAGATVAVRDHPEHGEILVDGEGMTLYMFDSDTPGDLASTCSGGCAEAWPPLTTDGEPTAGDGVTAELETFEREDGSTQVAANGWPLYYFQDDEAPGEANGQGVSEVWWVLGPDGTPKRPERASVAVASHPDHGDILVDGKGMTLYMFDSDTQGAGASTCSGGCADAWPPLTTEAAPAAGDAVEAELTTFEREDDTTQVAANGWPLYYFQQDEEPGDANGQGVSDVWWVLDPAGTPQRPQEASSASTPEDSDDSDDSDDGSGGGGGSTY